MSDYIISLKCDKDLGNINFVRDFLESWLEHPIKTLRPDKYDFGEPVRKPFDSKSCSEAIDSWVERGRAVMLKRSKKPSFLADLQWRRERGKDSRLFPWGATVWLNKASGDDKAEALLEFLIEKMEPAFAYLSTEDDERQKHFVQYKDRIGMVEKYVGLEIGDTLSGIYWRTYLSEWAIEKLGGRSVLENLDCGFKALGSGVLVSAFEKSEEAQSEGSEIAESDIVSVLGADHFFDKKNFDPESLKVSKQTAKVIEEKVATIKANGHS
ncbi:MAG: hypothetical protein AAGB19_16450 [Cyanobacteria bacterium P01_F01_bin.3]